MNSNFYLPSMSPRYGMPMMIHTFNNSASRQCPNIHHAFRRATCTDATGGSIRTTPLKEQTPKQPRETSSTPKASEEDARRAGIPSGYSYESWDPTEEPIMLLGSVFDANSLGKWIYDWTVFYNGPATPLAARTRA